MFSNLLLYVTILLEQHPLAAYAAVFLLAMSEALPGIGIVVPGTAVILGISAMVPSGIVQLWPMLAATVSGAIVGDGLSYWLGHRYQRKLLSIWPMSRYPDVVDAGESFFKRHGDKSVFLARFVPGVRAVVPLCAGIAGMSVWRFYFTNVLSAVAWTLSHVLPAVLVGATIAQFGSAARPLSIVAATLVVLLWVAWRIVRLFLRHGLPWIVRRLARTRRWARRGDGFAAKTVARLLGRTPSDAILLLVAGGIIVGMAWIFLGILEDVVHGDPLVRADDSVFQGLKALRTESGDAFMVAITELGDTVVVSVVTASVFVFLALRRAWRSAILLLVAVAGGAVVNTVIKGALHRARPEELDYRGWSEFSFPSGHSTSNAILYGFLALLIARQAQPAWRPFIALAATSFALCIAFSRVYLGAHWLSDVAAGLSFGMLWLTAVSFVLLRARREAIRPEWLALVAGLALATAGGLNVYRSHSADIGRYEVRQASFTLPETAWLQDAWRQLPDRRVDLTGEVEEPFTLQIAGPLSEIESLLAAKGWKPPPSWSGNMAAWLAPKSGPDQLPVFPLLASGRLADLELIRSDPGSARSRLVLRLWRTGLTISDDVPHPVWLASVVHERLYTFLLLATRTRSDNEYLEPRNTVAAAFRTAVSVARAAATDGWDGQVYLVGHGR